LRILHVARNKLTEIPRGAFDHLVSLFEIDFSFNFLTTFEASASIQWIYLSNNKISEFNVSRAHNLAHLKMNGNNLTKLTSEMFPKKLNLVVFSLKSNSIEAIDKKLIEKLNVAGGITQSFRNNPCAKKEKSGKFDLKHDLKLCFENYENGLDKDC
jgi:Leucine-rich repeat (LRR) protein